MASQKFKIAHGFLPTLFKPTSEKAEAVRVLRTHVMARHVQEGHRALAICSASSNVGCTFVAVNLATSLSQIGINTLLIDANLRQPAVDKIFHLETPRAGLQQCLMQADPNFSEYIEADVLPSLSVMFAGGSAPNAQELLANDHFHYLMNSCLRDFDATIVDTPPANSCSDARRISNVVSYSLIVARRNKSFVNDIKILAEQLRGDRATVIGTVLNDD